MDFTRAFSRISKNDAAIAGGKGASLGEMTQAGIPVPPGFVVLSTAFEHFLQETDLDAVIESTLRGVQQNDIRTVQCASESIRSLIHQAQIPATVAGEIHARWKSLRAPFVAVRSSATAEDSRSAAWAGLLESYLNTTREGLVSNVRECYASLFTPRAILYRFARGFHDQKVSVAVVVQEMIQSESSGSAISIHPITEESDQLIIEAVWGLGQAIGSGEITPDSYTVTKDPRTVIQTNIVPQRRGLYRMEGSGNEWRNILETRGKEQVLTEDQILRLSELIIRIEDHYGAPQDIEWAHAHGTFYILQTRPLTTRADSTRHTPKPIDQRTNYTIRPGGGRSAFFYPHYSIAHMYSVEHDLWPLDLEAVASFEDHYVRWYTILEDNGEFDTYLDRFIEDPTLITRLEEYIESVRETTVLALNNANLVEMQNSHLSKLINQYYNGFEEILRAAGTLRCVDRTIVPRLQELFGSAPHPDELVRLASIGNGSSVLAEERRALLKLAINITELGLDPTSDRTLEEIQSIKERYCWCVCGYHDERARTTSDYVSLLTEILQEAPNRLLAEMDERSRQEQNARDQAFSDLGGCSKLLVEIAGSSSRLKDYFKFSINKMIYFSEGLFAEIAQRVGENVDFIKDLYPNETSALLRGEAVNRENVRNRVQHSVLLSARGRFAELIGSEAVEFKNRHLAIEHSHETALRGRVASRGSSRGRTKVVLGQRDFEKLQDGDVLVVRNVSPDFVPLLRRAVAIVAEEGGLTAHVSLLSREFGLPCIVGVTNATALLTDGDFVEVDADKGTVNVIERTKGHGQGVGSLKRK